MPQIYRRLALAGLVILGGFCFSQLAPVVAAFILLPASPSPSSEGMADYLNQLIYAGTVIRGLWVMGMVMALGGIVYGVLALGFSPVTDKIEPSELQSPTSSPGFSSTPACRQL